MSKGNDAADAIRRVSKTLEQFKLAIEVLDEYGSFENAAKEAKLEHEKIADDLVKEKKRIESLKKESAGLQETIETNRAKLINDINNEQEKSKKIIADMVVFAQSDAKNIVDAARASMASEREVFNAEIADLTAKKAWLEVNISEMNIFKADLEKRVRELEAKLDKIRAQANKIAAEKEGA